jgi:FlaA1/EpsC-like NDP-sugar epimerase
MKIFITGITGTLGQAFVDYLAPNHSITGIDHNEERVAALQSAYPNIRVKLGDFDDVDFSTDKPDVVLHLAAFKHIDLAEDNPSAAILNNVIKTYNLFQNAHRNGVKILFMSTDKAVEPCSVYGYSKALMERMALELGGVFIRSGNILSSNGSVLDLWDKSIEKGEPLKLTHQDMQRFFISPENLAKRAWQLYLSGEKTIIPEMDMNITLLELAETRLREHGLSIETYPIVFTGLRKGEKLREKLREDEK